MKLAEAQTRIEKLARSGEPFERVEAAIDGTDFGEDEKSALWLLAWSHQERRVRVRVAKEALAGAGTCHGRIIRLRRGRASGGAPLTRRSAGTT